MSTTKDGALYRIYSLDCNEESGRYNHELELLCIDCCQTYIDAGYDPDYWECVEQTANCEKCGCEVLSRQGELVVYRCSGCGHRISHFKDEEMVGCNICGKRMLHENALDDIEIDWLASIIAIDLIESEIPSSNN